MPWMDRRTNLDREKPLALYSAGLDAQHTYCTNTSSILLLPSVGPDNLRPEAGLEDWRGEMGSGVSDWVAPGLASGTTSPGLHSSPPGFSPYLPLHSTNLQSLRTKSRRLPFLAFHFTSGRLELLVSYPWALGPGPPQERHLQMSH